MPVVRKGCGLESEQGTGPVILGAVLMKKDNPGVVDVLQQLRYMGPRNCGARPGGPLGRPWG